MFSKVLVFSALVAVVLSATAPLLEVVPVISQALDVHPDGAYQYNYESGDGSKQEQHGVPKVLEKDVVIEAVEGSVSFSDPDGVKHELTYVADENGYQPKSADLPVAPPAPEIPAAIQRALDWNAAHPEPEMKA
ncbi:unnamed protein product [Ceutorhynchus assimilis]|uniref:Uncharacterized protein n=1 Tax=Ceutorhynchus assimilis TaxID=467358 RepID=A0A9N9QQ38_9CUCU|nr:unnamed protein product [Ceutorhynchus assimilis]